MTKIITGKNNYTNAINLIMVYSHEFRSPEVEESQQIHCRRIYLKDKSEPSRVRPVILLSCPTWCPLENEQLLHLPNDIKRYFIQFALYDNLRKKTRKITNEIEIVSASGTFKYRSGTVNSNTVNSKLIRSFCQILARFLSFHV